MVKVTQADATLQEQPVEARIADRLRRDIIAGRLPKGRRLPNREALRRHHGASLATVQAAIDRLVTEGFLHVGSRKLGTFVSAHPPHLHHYKVIFPYAPEERGAFWETLRDAAIGMADADDRSFSFFYGFGGHRDLHAYQELTEDVRCSRVAGLIFASGATEFKGTPILNQPGIPRVAIADSYELPGIPKLAIDFTSFFDLAIGALARLGRRRIAVLFGAAPGQEASPVERAFRERMAVHGLAVNPLWLQYVHLWCAFSARNCVRLLLHSGHAERPDALIIADDNVLTAATQGVADAGCADPASLSVVALANFPTAIPAAVPVVRIGFDVRGVLAQAARIIDDLRAGDRTPTEFQVIPAVTEEDYVNGCPSSPLVCQRAFSAVVSRP